MIKCYEDVEIVISREVYEVIGINREVKIF